MKVEPLRESDYKAPVILARTAEIIDDITEILVAYRTKDGTLHLRTSETDWEKSAAVVAFIQAALIERINKGCYDNDADEVKGGA